MENRIYFLIITLIISCLGQTVHAAELMEGLGTLTTSLTNLAKKITGRALPAIPPGKQPPPEVSEKEPKFSKSFSFAYAETPDRKFKYIKIGLVEDGVGSKTYNLVVYGPKLINTVPQDFIVQKEIPVFGQALPKIEDRLSFPVSEDKAKNITWSSSGVLQEGPLASFILIKATDYKVPKKQKPDDHTMTREILPRITSAIRGVSILPTDKTTPFVTQSTAQQALEKIQKVTAECKFILENNLLDDTKKAIDDLREKAPLYIDVSLEKAKTFTDIYKSFNEEKFKLDNCLKDIADRQEKHILYSFYETYLEKKATPEPISDWWVASERKIKKPAIPEKPEEEPTGSAKALNLNTIGYALQQDYFEAYRDPTLSKIGELFTYGLIKEDVSPLEKDAYSKLSDEEKRERFMLLKTNYENPETGKFFNLKELLAYFMQRVSSTEYSLMNTWNFNVHLGGYTWPPKN